MRLADVRAVICKAIPDGNCAIEDGGCFLCDGPAVAFMAIPEWKTAAEVEMVVCEASECPVLRKARRVGDIHAAHLCHVRNGGVCAPTKAAVKALMGLWRETEAADER